ncbi:MAG: DNA polymerase III subunit delta [Actinomycetota bacterium]
MAKQNKKLCQLFISRSSAILDEKVDAAKKKLKGKINMDTDFKVFDNPEDLDETELVNYLAIPPFFSEKKVAVMKNIENFPAGIVNILADRIDGLDNSSFVFYLFTANKKRLNKKFLDAVKARGIVRELREPKTGSLRKWLKERQQLDGIHITEKAGELLLENINYDLSCLKNEYEKLFLYAQSQKDKKVTVEAVSHLVSRVYNLRIFDLVDCIGEKDKDGALKALKSMLVEGQNLMGMITLAYRMFKAILYINYGENRKAYDYISSNIRAPDYFIKKILDKYKRYSANYTEAEISRAFGLLNETDISLRESLVSEKNIISKLISEICS